MNIYYSKQKNALVYCGVPSNSSTWDDHWDDSLKSQFTFNSFVVNETKKYLPKGSKIIEGGCGIGDKVYSLKKAGYDVLGVDFAEKTVNFLKQNTDLNIELGDITHLHYPDASFDGYWSLGVIEHFIEGVDAPVKEISRVLKPGGYLFLTVPSMSSLRKMKSRFNMYEVKEDGFQNFFQYIYPAEFIINKFENSGFKLMEQRGMDGFKGLKDELGLKVLGKIYKSKSLPSRVVKKAVNLTLASTCGHGRLFVFKKS